MSRSPDPTNKVHPRRAAKSLRLWNGRDYGARDGHLYIAAYSRADAARLYCEGEVLLCGLNISERPDLIDKRRLGQADREIRTYFSAGCWGNSMDGITPERGIWHQRSNHSKPRKLRVQGSGTGTDAASTAACQQKEKQP